MLKKGRAIKCYLCGYMAHNHNSLIRHTVKMHVPAESQSNKTKNASPHSKENSKVYSKGKRGNSTIHTPPDDILIANQKRRCLEDASLPEDPKQDNVINQEHLSNGQGGCEQLSDDPMDDNQGKQERSEEAVGHRTTENLTDDNALDQRSDANEVDQHLAEGTQGNIQISNDTAQNEDDLCDPDVYTEKTKDTSNTEENHLEHRLKKSGSKSLDSTISKEHPVTVQRRNILVIYAVIAQS